ncbi:hypothetical protein [uncultured Bradyrhizobium sp.]|uniref:hypothetical protein n=1 Tax=uncultured Bradyrhizobium sp. TaxID=199684 RepID=UPI002610E1D6|nr:hypothetical protein [uncultured Bradyrhizobium sp.]
MTITSGPPTSPIPTIAALQTDIGFANQFRLELIKTTFLVATGLLAFTVSFRPSVPVPKWEGLMWLGWIALGLSTIGAMGNLYGWERFYASYRDYKNNQADGERARHNITRLRRIAMTIQFGGFALGVLSIALFAAANLDNVKPTPPAKELSK